MVNNYLLKVKNPIYGTFWNSIKEIKRTDVCMRKNKNIVVRRTKRSVLHGSNKDDKKDCQYPILNDILYITKSLFMFGESKRPFCFFGSGFDKRLPHLFYLHPNTSTSYYVGKLFFKTI